MFRVINFTSLLRYVAVLTTFISIAAYEFLQRYLDGKITIIKIFSIAPWIALVVVLAITTSVISRPIWKVVRKFDKSLFPDLNGSWEGEITTENNLEIPARAVIRQTLLQTLLQIHTETSKSLTLETTPATESGQRKLYYFYRSIPKDSDRPTYIGATIFDIRVVKDNGKDTFELSGSYFTDRKSKGRIRFRQVSNNVDTDVSFY